MSATAFQRMRREAAAKKAAKEDIETQSIKVDDKVPPVENADASPIDTETDKEKQGENVEVPPTDINSNECEEKQLSDMTVEELKEYAEKNNIDTGKATSQAGILEKIKVAEKTE